MPESTQTTNTFVRLSFRKGGETTFYASLKKALKSKGWDRGERLRTTQGEADGLDQGRRTTVGIGMQALIFFFDIWGLGN
jgi:hypothetical protein